MPKLKKTTHTKLELALLVKQLKRIPDWQLAEFAGIKRQTLNEHLERREKAVIKYKG